MKRFNVLAIALVAMQAVVFQLSAAEFFSAKGSVQLGGEIVFSSYGDESRDDRYNEFSFEPIVNFFPIDYLFVGPVFDFTVGGSGGYNEAWFGIGGRCGFAYGKDMPVIPFAYVSPRLIIHTWDDDNPDNDESDVGFGTEFGGGIIIPIQEHFSVNVGPGFRFQVVDGFSENTFFMGVSVTGLIF